MTDLNHKFLIQICLEPEYGSGQVFCFVCLSRIWFWMLSRKKINVYDVHFRSPFGSWMRKECHHKGGIAEARLKLYSKATAVLCIADVVESPPWSGSLFPGVTLSSVSSILRAESGPAYQCEGVKKMLQLQLACFRKELHSCKTDKVLEMVLSQMISSREMVDEKMLQEVLYNKTSWGSFGFSAFLDGF